MTEAQTKETNDIVADVTALLQQSRLPEATELARQALDRGIEAPLLLNLRAYWLEREGRDMDSLGDLKRAHTLAPEDITVLNALGLCLARLGQTRDGFLSFQKCTVLAPGFFPGHFNCGWTSERLGELDQAQRYFEAAMRLDPDSADPPGYLASLAARRGRWSAARMHAKAALERNPQHAPATIALAGAELAEQSYASGEKRLRALLDVATLNNEDRALALGLLADFLDAQERFSAAFTAYSTSNALFRKVFAAQPDVASTMSMSAFAGWLLSHFDRPDLPPWTASPPLSSEDPRAPARHVFVLGFSRSGTTLLEETLACHPDVITTGEKDALGGLAPKLMLGPTGMERLSSIGAAAIERYRRHYWEMLGELGIPAAGKILVDKQPLNTVRLPLIARLFPDAKIVFCLRDPRDVVLSCFRRRFAINSTNFEFLTLDGTAKVYDTVMRLARVYRAKLPVALHEIRSEQLVDDFEKQMRTLCDFLEIGWVPEFLDFAQRSAAREVSTPSSAQILRGLNREGVGHWRNYAPEMADVLPQLAPWVEHFNYPPD